MNFTFGIITGGNNEININQIIDSIENQNIPNYEIIIVGDCNLNRKKTHIVKFNERSKPMWITKKKNIITNTANYDNIVYLHDYVKFNDKWYEGQIKSGSDFKVRMDKIIDFYGNRFRDWCIWPHNNNFMDSIIERDCLIPYNMIHLSKYMYISGTYWIAKKEVMLEFPLDENLSWGQGEDVLWSKQVRNKYEFNMNSYSTVQLIKLNKDKVFNEPNEEKIKILNNIKN
jgi:hypothetical protein